MGAQGQQLGFTLAGMPAGRVNPRCCPCAGRQPEEVRELRVDLASCNWWRWLWYLAAACAGNNRRVRAG